MNLQLLMDIDDISLEILECNKDIEFSQIGIASYYKISVYKNIT